MHRFFRKKVNNNEKEDRPIVISGLQGSPIQKLPLDVLHSLLSLLDHKSLAMFLQTNRFFAEQAKADQYWKEHVNQLLTSSPQLMPNESYYAFVLRCKPFLLAVKNLSATKENKVLALMYEVAEQGLEKLFLAIIQQCPQLINKAKTFKNNNQHHKMIVHAAATNAAILQILAEYKFDLNARCNGFISTGEGAWLAEDCGLSVFDIAAMDGACESMKVLIANQVSINSTNCYGETPLHYVASQGHFDGVQLLVGAGARLDIKNRDEEIPYELAVKHREIQLYLAEKMKTQGIPIPPARERSSCALQ